MSYQCIVDACRACWEGNFIPGVANKNNCSGLVKAVAQKLNIPMINGQADAIMAWLDNDPSWKKIVPAKTTVGEEAKIKAETGHFVVAGLKSSELSYASHNGHVVVVVGGDLHRGIYPKCWSGSASDNGRSSGDKSVGHMWRAADRDKVHYYYYAQFVVCKFN